MNASKRDLRLNVLSFLHGTCLSLPEWRPGSERTILYQKKNHRHHSRVHVTVGLNVDQDHS